MLVEERRQKLSDLVSSRGFMPLGELAAAVGVSESTVRRDLDVLCDAGLLRRTHGGAAPRNGTAAAIYHAGNQGPADRQPLPAFEERAGRQTEEKRRIGRAVAALVRDGDTVLLDAGTTTFEVARCLAGRPVQVATNSLPIATLLSNGRDTEVILIGGYVYPKTGAALGPLAERALAEIHVRHCVLGVAGLDHRGLYNGNALLVETERAMMRCADEVTVAADSSKFGQQALCFLADWTGVRRVVADDKLSAEQRALVGPGVEVLAVRDSAGGEQREDRP